MAHVVVVEDEREIARLIQDALREEGRRVEVVHEGRAALDRLLGPGRQEPDLIVLDLMLPGVDGLEICRRVRQSKITPILMLTAKSTELDRVLGLELGADDYLTKPFSMRELQARAGAPRWRSSRAIWSRWSPASRARRRAASTRRRSKRCTRRR